jgi:signal transduction histidine kinase
VLLNREDGFIKLEVRDQGQGMKGEEESSEGNLGVGLLSVRERVRQLSGRLEIISDKGKGTSVVATIPDVSVGRDPSEELGGASA